jgi:ribosomal protein S18 acetylase RimI-like enzyme
MLAAHLRTCDHTFVPPLSQRVDIDAYAQRLADRAERFEVWQGQRLIGVVAAYLPPGEAEAFVSNVSIDPAARGRGLARRLLTDTIAEAHRLGLRRLRLEVNPDNTAAANLYSTLGFRRSQFGAPLGASTDAVTLVLEL